MNSGTLYDSTTGLPGPALLLDRLDVAVNRSQRTREPVALVYVGIDSVDAEEGSRRPVSHDEAEAEIARRLTASVRAHDSVARIGPSLFAILASGDLDGDTIRLLAGRILFELSPPVQVAIGQGYPESWFVTASIGAAIYSADQDLVCVLASQAVIALQIARAQQRIVIVGNNGREL